MSDLHYSMAHELADGMRAEFVRNVCMPQEQVEVVIGTMLLNGAVLLEGAPGLGKTETGKTLARMIGGRYDRIQGTPDTQPTDIIGVEVANKATGKFEFVPGPIFSEVTLLDEINRMTPRTSAAFLQAMGEKEVTVNRQTYRTGNVVTIATQNPHEIAAGTYPLTVAQKDRFMAGVVLPPLSDAQVIAIADKEDNKGTVKQVATVEQLRAVKSNIAHSIVIPSEVKNLGAAIRSEVAKSKDIDPENSSLGGARSYMDMAALARVFALFRKGRTVSAEDMRRAAVYALPHRLELSMQASIANEKSAIDIVKAIAKNTK